MVYHKRDHPGIVHFSTALGDLLLVPIRDSKFRATDCCLTVDDIFDFSGADLVYRNKKSRGIVHFSTARGVFLIGE